MSHQDKGHFAAKHENKSIEPTVSADIQKSGKDNCLTCAAAHLIAKRLSLSPTQVGVQTDLLEYRITDCQMGLFGFLDKKKRIDPNINIPGDLEKELDKKNEDGRISCLECWNIAKQMKVKKLDIGSACEKKKIRIKPCQLGAF
ncbi:MAG: hypothetical protein L3J69_08695 [Desulfobacula sp.]|nr:hypothetical protein [Desulfobacula sp.]